MEEYFKFRMIFEIIGIVISSMFCIGITISYFANKKIRKIERDDRLNKLRRKYENH